MNRPTWDETFLEICDVIAKKSKDESTKVGCVIVGENNEILSVGYNCFPCGIIDNDPDRQIRPDKYMWLEHSERNAIYNAARNGTRLENSTIYIPWHPCSDCARAIIQVGIKEIVLGTSEIMERWGRSCEIAATMLKEAGIYTREVG